MAEGGVDLPDIRIDENTKTNDEDDRETLNKTGPFISSDTSTPHPKVEQIQMQTLQKELPLGRPSYEEEETSFGGDETPLLGQFLSSEEKKSVIDRTIDFIKRKYPKVDLKKLGPIGFSKKGAQTEVVSFGSRGGETKILKQDGSGLLKSFTDKFSKSLGQSAEQIIAEDRDTIQEQRQRLADAEKQQREAETIAAAREEELQEMENLKQQTERTQARIEALQEEHGSNLESEAELRRLKLLK